MGSESAPTSLLNTIPTLARLNATIPDDLNVQKVAQDWVARFSKAVESHSVPAVLDTLHPDGLWRDLVALTWDLRTFEGAEKIKTFLNDRLVETQFRVSPPQPMFAQLSKPYPGVQWIVLSFGFETGAGVGQGIAVVVPTSTGEWVAFIVTTDLDSIKGTKPRYGPGRDASMNRGDVWVAERRREQAFEDTDPEVLIIGAGQAGLGLAARLKNMGVSTLIVEKNARVSDQWRERYDSLRMQTVVWADHMPFLQFPDNFPVHIPASKLADWYEFYAKIMDLNVWCSTTVVSATQDAKTNKWHATVKKEDGTKRTFCVDQLVFASGWVGEPRIPKFPGREEFQGQVLHSAEYKNAKPFVGKKVLIVGASASGHDVAADCVHHGVDVTMIQRRSTFMIRTKDLIGTLSTLYTEGGIPLALADRFFSAVPPKFGKLTGAVEMQKIVADDGARREKLEKLGYRINKGPDDAGFLWHLISYDGGRYIDQGACDLIIEGKIKLKSEATIDRYTKNGLKLGDGTELKADVIVLATGYENQRESVIKRIVGEEVGKKITRLWGTNEEGELHTVYKEMGVPGLWYLSGPLVYCRMYSKHTALQIKAKQAGVFTTRYGAPPVY